MVVMPRIRNQAVSHDNKPTNPVTGQRPRSAYSKASGIAFELQRTRRSLGIGTFNPI